MRRVHGNMTERKRKLGELLAEAGPTLSWQEKDRLRQLLLSHHRAFAIEKGDRGETDLVQMTIDTGDALPRRLPVRRSFTSPEVRWWHSSYRHWMHPTPLGRQGSCRCCYKTPGSPPCSGPTGVGHSSWSQSGCSCHSKVSSVTSIRPCHPKIGLECLQLHQTG